MLYITPDLQNESNFSLFSFTFAVYLNLTKNMLKNIFPSAQFLFHSYDTFEENSKEKWWRQIYVNGMWRKDFAKKNENERKDFSFLYRRKLVKTVKVRKWKNLDK